MQETALKEKNFEEAIEQYLITQGGYTKGNPADFNKATALDEQTFLTFIKTTQPQQWAKHCKNYPTNPENALLKRFQDEVANTSLYTCYGMALWIGVLNSCPAISSRKPLSMKNTTKNMPKISYIVPAR